MRLTQMNPTDWKEVAPFVDTLCLPVFSLRIREKEIQMESGEMVQYFAEELEKSLSGRLLLLPPVSYTGQNPEVFKSYLNEIIKDIRQSGFYYYVFILDGSLKDLVLEYSDEEYQNLLVYSMDLSKDATQPEIEEESQKLYRKVLDLWRYQS